MKALWRMLWLIGLMGSIGRADPNAIEPTPARAVVIPCTGMIDDGLYQSIKRRASQALEQGADVLILEIGTYGGLVKSADDISKYLIFDLAGRIHTVAYVKTEAISAGAMISVSCNDILMRANSTLGDCAPITLGGAGLKGVEREKSESFIRAIFDRAARANGYPQALLRAMVTMQIEVYRIPNRMTGENEFFESDYLPRDANTYDLEAKELIDPNDRLLTVDAATARDYGIARAVVQDRGEVLGFLAQRDHLSFVEPPTVLDTNWSEQMVRTLNQPAVMGIIVAVALLGLYMELSAPGLGLPGLVSVICFAVIIGSKYLHGMANWVEIAILVVGIILVLIEIFLIPGFGLAGISGFICILIGLLGLLVRNPPNRWPWPQTELDWILFQQGLWGFVIGIGGFVIGAVILTRFLPRWSLFSGLVLNPSTEPMEVSVPESLPDSLNVGDVGIVANTLRPAGKVRFGDRLVDCVAQTEFLEAGTQVEIYRVKDNHVVVRVAKGENA